MSKYKKVCMPHQRKGKGIVTTCSCCYMFDYCLDKSKLYNKSYPFYLCEFCRRNLSDDSTGSLHKLYGLPFVKGN